MKKLDLLYNLENEDVVLQEFERLKIELDEFKKKQNFVSRSIRRLRSYRILDFCKILNPEKSGSGRIRKAP